MVASISAMELAGRCQAERDQVAVMIVSVLNQKGGTGKTTIAVHIGMAWVRQGARVLLIDAQSSALDWSEARGDREPALPVIGLPKPTLHREVSGLAENCDHVIIDGPPQAEAIVRAAIMAADLVLIPVQPGGLDVWGARPVIALVADATPLKPNLKAAFTVNRKISKTFLSRAVLEALTVYRMPVLASPLTQRVAFGESMGSGLTVFDMDPDGSASAEVAALAKESSGGCPCRESRPSRRSRSRAR